MGIKSVPEGLSGQPDVSLVSLRDGQGLTWDATNSKWINGKEFIPAPTITSPTSGAQITAGVATNLVCSAFASAPNMNLVWFDNDWEVATNPAFDTVIYALYNQTGSATTVSATIPSGYSSVFIRVRQNTVDQKGVWSTPVRVIMLQTQYFNTSGNFIVPANTNSVTPFIVAGGSGAPQNSIFAGGGGGVSQPGAISVTPGSTIAVTVGAGNTGTTAGGSSSFGNTSVNGGAGTQTGNAGKASGNGFAGGAGSTSTQVSGGGGGAGGAGGSGTGGGFPGGNSTMVGGVGGNGVTVTVDGIARGGGGGGGANNSSNSLYAYSAGSGATAAGGGNGAGGGSSSGGQTGAATIGGSGTNGTGGGGGGNQGSSNGGSTGGNGVVILTWLF